MVLGQALCGFNKPDFDCLYRALVQAGVREVLTTCLFIFRDLGPIYSAASSPLKAVGHTNSENDAYSHDMCSRLICNLLSTQIGSPTMDISYSRDTHRDISTRVLGLCEGINFAANIWKRPCMADQNPPLWNITRDFS